MLKLLARIPYNFFYAVDLAVSALTFGAKGETISARFYQGTLSTSRWVRWPSIVASTLLDWAVLAVFGEANHTKDAYDAYVKATAAVKQA